MQRRPEKRLSAQFCFYAARATARGERYALCWSETQLRGYSHYDCLFWRGETQAEWCVLTHMDVAGDNAVVYSYVVEIHASSHAAVIVSVLVNINFYYLLLLNFFCLLYVSQGSGCLLNSAQSSATLRNGCVPSSTTLNVSTEPVSLKKQHFTLTFSCCLFCFY